MKVIVTRYGSSPSGTPGTLEVFNDVGDLKFRCYTVEQPWLFNVLSLSSIPIGEYTLKLDRFNRGGYDAYEVDSVPGRSEIKVHVGNDITDIAGCILPGLSLRIVDGLWFVGQSRRAFDQFMEAMERTRISFLKIKNAHSYQEGELFEVK